MHSDDDVHGAEDSSSAEDVSRRNVLGFMSGALSALFALALGIPLVGSFLGPLLSKKKPLWVKLGDPPVQPGQPQKYTFRYVRIDGWMEKVVYGTAYAVKQGEDMHVISNVCTHLGCGVRWDEDKKQFVCPCHNGRFDISGNVIAGPPPRPLDRFESKLIEGQVHILIKGA